MIYMGIIPWAIKYNMVSPKKLVYSKIAEKLGGNVIGIVSGSAPLQPRLIRFFTALGIEIMEGYGLTETSPIVCVNRFERSGRRIGTVGPKLNGVEVKLAEDGEILVKGPNVMIGYYKNEQGTAEVLTEDGWFSTGDIGIFEEGKFLKITDRKKQMFKTSGGKYICPQPIENKFKESPFIEQIMVVGEYQKFPGAYLFQLLKP
jgi:long-chain acyl-CoA synthetase